MKSESEIRIDLAVALRLSAKLGMTEAVANHFSAAVSEDEKSFLLNPKWVHFSKVKASDLVLVNAYDPNSFDKGKIDSTAWAIHGQIHQLKPDISVIMHLHPIYATALSCLKDPTLLPIEQNSARYFNRVSYDSNYSGMADQIAEGQRLAALLQKNSRLLMGNHGVLIGSHDIGVAFDDMYTFERASQILIHAYSTGQTLNILEDHVAEKTAQDWQKIEDFSKAHFEEMKAMLIKEDPSVIE